MQTSIRFIEPKHLEQAASTHYLSWRAEHAGQLDPGYIASNDLDHFRGHWSRLLQEQLDGDARLIGAFNGNGPGATIVGVARVGKYSGQRIVSDLANPIEVSSVYVHPDHQRNGVGRRMVNAAESHGRVMISGEAATGVLWVVGMKERQRCFYESLGWKAETDRAFPEDRGGETVEVTRFTKPLSPLLARSELALASLSLAVV